jgi:hypothetical protein
MLKSILFLSAVILGAQPLFAFDFHIQSSECKATLAPLFQTDKPKALQVVDGAPSILSCTRNSGDVKCIIDFLGVGEKKPYNYTVDVETGNILRLTNQRGTDTWTIDRVRHTAVGVSQALDEKSVIVKVCHGLFFTESEAKEVLRKK